MKHLLIVEDDAENNEILREYLEGHGYTCTQAFSGVRGGCCSPWNILIWCFWI